MSGRKPAEETIRRARETVRRAPLSAPAHRRLAKACERAGRLDEAEAHFREAMLLQPGALQPRLELGDFFVRRKRHKEAEALYRELARVPAHAPAALTALGNLARRAGDAKGAAGHYRAALEARADYPPAHNALGIMAADRGDRDGAIACYRRALEAQPNFASARLNLGRALAAEGRLGEAAAEFRRAVSDRPRDPAARVELAELHNRRQDRTGAIEEYRRALAVAPRYLPALVNIGNLLKEEGRPDEAIAFYRRALQMRPDFAPTHSNIAGLLTDQGRVTEGLAHYDRAVGLKPDFVEAASNRLLTLHYTRTKSPAEIAEEHFAWHRRFAAPRGKSIAPHPNVPDPDRRLRVGYVSPDLRTHPVAFFLEPVLQRHDEKAVEVFCYANQTMDDAVTDRLRASAHHWRSINRIDDDGAAAIIREDGIDVLVDLAGHTARNRLLLFARKPAPVQVTWLGYPDTTGLSAIDYRITDARADPEGATEAWHSERLLRLPHGFLCYAPPPDSPAPAPPPAAKPGAVTFGSFNNPAKISPEVIAAWADILRRLPDSRLLMKALPLADAGPRRYFTDAFEKHGVAADRLRFHARIDSISDHLDFYRQVDIALDSFPYNGTTITCEALYMGVPVVILEGDAHVSRVGCSLAHSVGVPDLVARDPAGYVALAVELAGDLAAMQAYRAGLRDRMRGSALMDAQAFTSTLEAAYRAIWRDWCAHRV